MARQLTRIIDKTYSYCPKCYKIIPSNIIKKDGKVFLQKKCTDGFFEIKIENDANFYRKIIKYVKNDISSFKQVNTSLNFITNEELIYKEIIIYLTPKCNMNCPICFIEKKDKEVPIETIRKLLLVCKGKWIVLSGGEPTLRDDLPEIVNEISKSGNIPLIQTNGIKLSDFEYAKKLKNSGLKFIHFSFNGFNKKVYRDLYGDEDTLQIKLKSLENMKKLGYKVFLSMSVVEGMEKDIAETIEFTNKNHDYIKGILIRPVFNRITEKTDNFTISDVVKMIEKATNKKITREDFIEFKRFRWVVNRIIKRLFDEKFADRISPDVRLGLPLIVKGGKYKLLFNHTMLKKLNDKLEHLLKQKSNTLFYIKLVKLASNSFTFLKKDSLTFLFSIFVNKLDQNKTKLYLFDSIKNIIHIWVDEIHGPQNTDLNTGIGMYKLIIQSDGEVTFAPLYAA